MKKILFLSPLPPPHYGSAMSSEMCLNILKDSKDFDIRNIKLNYSEKINDIGKINSKKLKGIFVVLYQIKKEIQQFKPDIIYFMPATYKQGLIRDWIFVNKIKKLWKGRILFHVRGRVLDKTWSSFFGKRMLKKIFFGQKVIVLGKELVEDLHGLISQENIFILPNAIENEISEEKIEQIIKQRKNKTRFDILFLSNMNKSKGWMKLLRACKILNNKKKNFHCNFVGVFPNKKEEEKFNSFIKKNNLCSRVKYFGKKTGEEKNKILGNSDIFVFPTEYELETFGRVILEAMMSGLPVIASGIATIPTTIQDGKTGFILKSNTSQEIAEKIERLIGNAKLREDMGRLGRTRFLEQYEIKKYGEKFLNILEMV